MFTVNFRHNRVTVFGVLSFSLLLAACGGGGYGSSGGNNSCGGYSCASSSSYSMSSSSSSASTSSTSSSSSSSSAGTVTSLSVNLTPYQIFPMPNSGASATASLQFDSATNMASGTVTLTGVNNATAVTLNDAFAGNNGTAIATLTAGATSWAIPANTVLTAGQWNDLWAGKLYLLVTSPAFPQGEIRGQVMPSGVEVIFSDVTPALEVPAITPTATTISGRAAVTVSTAVNMAAVNINLTANNATGAQLLTGDYGVNGTAVATLVVDNANSSHWMNETIAVTGADVVNFTGNMWYVNVSTTAHASGEARGQIQAPPTLGLLQSDIFTPKCSGCHSGVGSTLPGVQNLTDGNTYASVVGVASIEQSSLMRIQPGDPDNSYLVHKVEGGPAITGVQMPAAGGLLTQTQIGWILAWVTAGAPNN